MPRTLIKSLIFASIFSSIAHATPINQIQANKTLVLNSYDNNFNRKDASQVTKFINPNQYIQHSINGKDGVSPLINYIGYMKEKMPSFAGKNIRMIGEGDLVVSQTEESIDGKPVDVSMDLYRIKNGQIVEHWDAVQNYTTQTPANANGIVTGPRPNPNSQLDPQKVREVARQYFKQTWGKLNTAAIDRHVAPDLIQHNPQVADGRGALKALVQGLKASKTPIKVEIARILVEKDFAVVHAKWTDESGSYALFDVLRLNDNYQIAEHWDVMGEKIPADNKNKRDPVF